MARVPLRSSQCPPPPSKTVDVREYVRRCRVLPHALDVDEVTRFEVDRRLVGLLGSEIPRNSSGLPRLGDDGASGVLRGVTRLCLRSASHSGWQHRADVQALETDVSNASSAIAVGVDRAGSWFAMVRRRRRGTAVVVQRTLEAFGAWNVAAPVWVRVLSCAASVLSQSRTLKGRLIAEIPLSVIRLFLMLAGGDRFLAVLMSAFAVGCGGASTDPRRRVRSFW